MDQNTRTDWLFLSRGFTRAFSIDYRSLALFRVLAGSIIIVDLVLRCRDFTAFFTDSGIVTRDMALQWNGTGTWSLYFINGSTSFTIALIGLAMLAAACLVVGYRTRLATLVSWVMLVSLHQRTGILSAGAEDLLRVLVFWGMFLPLGARCSIDAALEKAQPHRGESHFSIATIAILMQAMYVYWVGALLKTDAAWTQDYSAIYFALNAEHYASAAGMWLEANYPALLPLLTRFVYYIELYGPLLMLSPVLLLWLRLPTLVLLIAMHVGFILFLNVGHFPFISISSLLLFIPPEVWNRLRAWWSKPRSEGIVVYYDKGCGFCLKTVLILKQLLILPDIVVKPAQDDPEAGPLLEQYDSWVVRGPDGQSRLEWEALVWLVSRSPWCGWLHWPMRLLNPGGLGNRVYHTIGNNRGSLSKLSEALLPWRESRPSRLASFGVQSLVAVLAAFTFYINVQPLYPDKLPEEYGHIKSAKFSLGLWQKWDMFAPRPIGWTQWPIYLGETFDGRTVDMFRLELGHPGEHKPEHVLADYSNYRWRKYYGRLYLKRYAYMRPRLVKYLCKQWNIIERPSEDHIFEIRLKMANEQTLRDKTQERTVIDDMGSYSCF